MHSFTDPHLGDNEFSWNELKSKCLEFFEAIIYIYVWLLKTNCRQSSPPAPNVICLFKHVIVCSAYVCKLCKDFDVRCVQMKHHVL